MNRNGRPSRLVPSLDGSLYQMDGEGIEPIPLAADLLLTSTYKLTDDASIVGGKEIETYGINISTGKVGRWSFTVNVLVHNNNNNNVN